MHALPAAGARPGSRTAATESLRPCCETAAEAARGPHLTRATAAVERAARASIVSWGGRRVPGWLWSRLLGRRAAPRLAGGTRSKKGASLPLGRVVTSTALAGPDIAAGSKTFRPAFRQSRGCDAV